MPRPYELIPFTYTGTGAALQVTLRSQPKAILAFNNTDGDTLWGFFEGMSAATAWASAAAITKVSTQGCTPNRKGFLLGTDAAINENAKVYFGVALV